MNSAFLSLQFKVAAAVTTVVGSVKAPGGPPKYDHKVLEQTPVNLGSLGASSSPAPQYKRSSGSAPRIVAPSQSTGFATGTKNLVESEANLHLHQVAARWFDGLKNDIKGRVNYFATVAAGPKGAAAAEAGTNVNSTSTTLINNNDNYAPKKKRDSPFKLAAALFCDALESAVAEIVKLQLNEEKPGNNNNLPPGLCGNYGPVDSEFGPSGPLLVIGTLPPSLNGEFVRVGPNPKFKPKANYSWFDGDGMLHGLRIKDGKVSYTSRYVRTTRLCQEEHYEGAKFIKAGDCLDRRGLWWALLQMLRVRLGVLDVSTGFGTANTALVFHNGKLLCLHEADKPYSILVHDNGELETIGRVSYDGKLDHPFTAHPKIDPVTGEMFVLGYNLELQLGKKKSTKPFVTYRVVSEAGEMRDPVGIRTSGSDPCVMHDFAITEHYAVFLDCPLYFRPIDMVIKDKGAFFFDKSQLTRFGILPRYAGDESLIRWFELPACMILHTANAWEEGEEVVLVACRSPSFTVDVVDSLISDHREERTALEFVSHLYELRFNLRTGEASQKQLGDFLLDYPGINRSYQGRRNRYVYSTIFTSDSATRAMVRGVAKFDLTKEPDLGKGGLEQPEPQRAERTNVAGVFWFGEGRCGSEAVFVPSGFRCGEEDEGHLVCYVHDENQGKSEAVVIDARTMSADPVAVIQFPTRVPYGFHGLFVPEQQLRKQEDFF